jgi:CheY-like chemotaxis protein
MPQGGTLRIESAIVELDRDQIELARLELTPGAYVALRVRDTGIGMESDVLARAFEPFFTTKEVGRGTGLGLSSVYGTVKQSGGHVTAASTPSVGTVITIHLPLQSPAIETTPVVVAPRAVHAAGQATILLVEDDLAVRNLAARVLRSAGYSVLAAENGPAAIAAARDFVGDIALMLSDVVMPGMSGIELVSIIEAARPEIAVLLMSGYPDAEIGRRGMRTHSFVFVEKPFTRGTLLVRVQQAIAERRAKLVA